jgi:DNA polymerase III subunit gamma/tau
MGKALYRTYRSKKLSEIIGQEHITTALDHALKKGTICHAYLFTGPKGIGKTSIARILAHEINSLPYSEDRPHLDIIEIDAASNRRIDEIRDLRDKVHTAPTSAKFKVYIIDEVHMLTKEAFNALLKTLEEPPAHVVFILATTEVHKLPETIISRTQRYAFKPVDLPKVVEHLKYIAKKEKISITDEALELIAAHGEGSFRDSISLLDQIRNAEGKVGLSNVQAMLGIAPAELIADILDQLGSHDSLSVAKSLAQMHEQGYEPAHVAKQLGAALRQEILASKTPLPHETSMRLLVQLVQVPASPDPRIALEIALLDAALSGRISGPTALKEKEDEANSKTMSEDVQANPAIQIDPKEETIESPQQMPNPATEPEAPEQEAAVPTNVDDGIVLNGESWEMVLNTIKHKYNTLYSLAKMARTSFDPGCVTLELPYAFHQKRLNDNHNKQILSEVIAQVTGSAVRINCIVGEGSSATADSAAPLPPAAGEVVHSVANKSTSDQPQPESVKTISNIFGGAELLES